MKKLNMSVTTKNPIQVSTVIPTYNRRALLAAAVRSALDQTFSHHEVLVIDDGSTDGTAADFRDPPPNVRYVYQSNQGESAARNAGIQMARGDLVALLDSDDLWLPTKLEKQVARLDKLGPEFGMIACDVYDIDQNGGQLSAKSRFNNIPSGEIDLETLLLRPPTASSSVVVRKSVLHEVGGFDENLHYGEDADLWLRISKKYRVAYLAEPLACMRSHSTQQTSYLLPLGPLARRIADRKRIVERVFDGLASDAHLIALKNAALAQDYAWAAISYYWNRSYDDGQRYMRKAILLKPDAWSDGKSFSDLIVHCAESIVTSKGPNDAEAFINAVFGHLPLEATNLATKQKRIFAHTCIASAFHCSDHHERKSTLRYLIRGLVLDPCWLRNRGVLSIFVKSILPSQLSHPRSTALHPRETES